jgi:methionyl-tRNA synthetase
LAPQLEEYLETRKGWRPAVLNFTRNWLKEGLQDRPITRDLHWGVPVPLKGYEGKCLYVWFEAVIGYLSASKKWAKDSGDPEGWRAFWEGPDAESYYFIGKDNIPFHTIIWPGMLLGHGGLGLPEDVPANEFLLLSGEKFSKSRGIGVRLKECLEAFDPDAIRYYLASTMPETADADFSWDDFLAKNNEEFLSSIANLVNRILAFAQRTYGRIPERGSPGPAEEELARTVEARGQALARALEAREFRKGLKEILLLSQAGNQYVNSQAPWKLAKDDPRRCQTVMFGGIDLVRHLAVYLFPYVPFTARKIWAMLGEPGALGPGVWAGRLEPLESGRAFGIVAPLVRKLEREGSAEGAPHPPLSPQAGRG